MLPKRIRSFVVPVILLVLLFISILSLANFLIQRPSVQKYLVKRLSNVIGFDIGTGDIELSLWPGIGILAHDFEATSRQGKEYIKASSIKIILDLGELIEGHIVPTELHLFQPKMELAFKDEVNPFTNHRGIEDNGMPLFWIPGMRSVLVEQGHVNFIDRSFSLDDLTLNARQTSPMPLTLMLSSSGKFEFKGKKILFDLKGVILPTFGDEVSASVDMMVKTGKIPLNWLPWPERLPMKDGNFEARLRIEGNTEEQTSVNGQILIDPVKFALLKNDREKEFSIPGITFDFRSVIKESKIRFQSLKIKNHDFSFDLDLMLDLKEKDEPYLELAAKSGIMTIETFKRLFPSPLVSSWLEDRLFLLLNNGDVKVNLLTLKGYIEQFRHMRMSKNRSVLGLDFGCQNFLVSGGGIKLPFNEVSATVSLKDGDLQISGLKADFGNSKIKRGELNVNGILSSSPSYEVLIDGSFDLQELIQQREMEVIPYDVRQQLNQLIGLKGRLECNASIGYEREKVFPRIIRGKFLFTESSLDRRELFLPLKFKGVEVQINESNQDSFKADGSWGNTAFNITGDFGITGTSVDIQRADIYADMDMNQVIPIVFQWDQLPVTFVKPLPLSISLEKKKDHWSCNGNIDLDEVTLECEGFLIDPPGRDQNIIFELGIKPDEKIDLKKILCRLKDSRIELKGAYDIQARYIAELDLSLSDLSLEDLGVQSKKDKMPVKGSLSGDVKIMFPGRDISDTNILGQIDGTDFYFNFRGIHFPISDCNFQLEFSGKQVAINHWNMKIGEDSLSIIGRLKGWNGLKGDIKINSDFFDISEILQLGDLPGNNKIDKEDSLINDMDIGINLDISKGVWRKIKFSPLKAELDLREGNIYIKNSDINLENGILAVKGHVITGKDAELLLSGDISLREQPIDILLESIGIGNGSWKGSLTMEALLSVKGRERKDLIPSLAGSANISINNGLVKKSRVFFKVLEFLSLQKVFKQRPSDLKEEGFYFESMCGDAIIDKGVLKSENFVMRSPIFNAVAYGKVDISQKKLDFILGAQPLGTIDTIVSNIPILGYIITGEKGSIVAYPFQVKGTISNPEVEYIPFEKLGENLGGILKRLFFTPIKLLKDLKNATKSMQKKD